MMQILNEEPQTSERMRSLKNVKVGARVEIWRFVNLYDCEIGDESIIGSFVEIQADVIVGQRCRIQSHSFICSAVTFGNDVFVGHGVMFINDNHPSAEDARNRTWQLSPVRVESDASIGSNATILGGVTIGRGARVGAGAVVSHDVPPGATVVGVPAKVVTKASL